MTATHDVEPTIPTTPVLYPALELGQRARELAFTVGLGRKPGLRTIPARDTEALMAEIAAASRTLRLRRRQTSGGRRRAWYARGTPRPWA